jgi:HYR domain
MPRLMRERMDAYPHSAEPRGTGRRAAAAAAAAIALPLAAAVPAVADAPAGKAVPAAQISGDGFAAQTTPAAGEGAPIAPKRRSGKRVGSVGDGFLAPLAFGSKVLIGDGVKFFVNTNITFSTTSSASGAMSEASMTASRDDVSTLNGGTTSDTLNDAFDGYNTLAVHVGPGAPDANPETANPNYVIYNKNGVGTLACGDREVRLNAQVVGDLTMRRTVYVPADAPVARSVSYLTNTGTEPMELSAYGATNLGSDSNTRIFATSSGDTVADLDDEWFGTFQTWSGTTSSDPRIGHVLQGRGAEVRLAGGNAADGDDNPWWRFALRLAPGETKAIATYVVVETNKAAAERRSAELAAAPLTACMSEEEIAQIANFDLAPPAFAQPAEVRAVAPAGAAGTVVDYVAPVATDAADGQVPVTCEPPSGSVFPVGTTTVTCTAADAAGNRAQTTFPVVVAATPVVEPPVVGPPVVEPPAPKPPLAPRLGKMSVGQRCVTPVGGTLPRLVARYTLAAPARVTYRIQTRAMKRVWTSCPTPRDEGVAPPPRRWRTLAQRTRRETAGRHAVAFVRRSEPGKAAAAAAAIPVLGKVGLAPGSYRLTITAVNDEGSRRIVRNFVVLPPAR